ncbi:transcriptional regulator [Streptomyces nogalater]
MLLTAHGTLAAAAWQRAAARAPDPAHAAELLLRSGVLPTGALELCHLDALYDAGYFALAPSGTPGRFRYGPGPRLGPLPSVPVVALEHETLRRRLLLHRLWPDPAADSAPLIRADPAPGPAPPRRSPPAAGRPGPRGRRPHGRRPGRDLGGRPSTPWSTSAYHGGRMDRAGARGPRPAPAPPPRPTATDPDIALLKRLRDALEAL